MDPPKTWDEFRDYAKKLTKRDAQGNITRVGYAIRHMGQPHGVVHKHLWAIYGAGAKLVDDHYALRGGKTMINIRGARPPCSSSWTCWTWTSPPA